MAGSQYSQNASQFVQVVLEVQQGRKPKEAFQDHHRSRTSALYGRKSCMSEMLYRICVSASCMTCRLVLMARELILPFTLVFRYENCLRLTMCGTGDADMLT
jgi:hypothetical protein